MLKIKGLKKAASDSKKAIRENCTYLQLNYVKSEKRCFTDFLCSIGYNSWIQYHDNDYINCGFIKEKMTMKEIKEMIIIALDKEKYRY